MSHTSYSHKKNPRVFLTAHWQHLAMLNYEIEPAALDPYLPVGTELDLFQGRALLTIFGVRFRNARVRGFSIPFHRNFAEVNLRFYVRRLTSDGLRRGVVALKEIVPLPAVALVARRVFKENFVAYPMRDEIQQDEHALCARYQWRARRAWHGLWVSAGGAATAAQADSEEAFVTERYWGYTRMPNGGTAEIRIERPPWKIRPASDARLDGEPSTVVDEPIASALQGSCRSALISEGSPSKVYQSVVVEPPPGPCVR